MFKQFNQLLKEKWSKLRLRRMEAKIVLPIRNNRNIDWNYLKNGKTNQKVETINREVCGVVLVYKIGYFLEHAPFCLVFFKQFICNNS